MNIWSRSKVKKLDNNNYDVLDKRFKKIENSQKIIQLSFYNNIMKKIKEMVAPVKIFMGVVFSVILGLLTVTILIPVTYLYNLDIESARLIYVMITGIYFISTISYLFNFKLMYERYKYSKTRGK